jgi:uridine kinase
MQLVLLSGLSNAGKSSFADFLEQQGIGPHVPLDKYFLPVPESTTFLNWVQHPQSIDWILLQSHLERLAEGNDCYSPAFDGWGSGKRLCIGGSESHPKNRLMKSNDVCIIPGCLSFEYPGAFSVAMKIFVDTDVRTIANRLGMEIEENLEGFLIRSLTHHYPEVLEYRRFADLSVSGDCSDSKRLEYLDLIRRKLT